MTQTQVNQPVTQPIASRGMRRRLRQEIKSSMRSETGDHIVIRVIKSGDLGLIKLPPEKPLPPPLAKLVEPPSRVLSLPQLWTPPPPPGGPLWIVSRPQRKHMYSDPRFIGVSWIMTEDGRQVEQLSRDLPVEPQEHAFQSFHSLYQQEPPRSHEPPQLHTRPAMLEPLPEPRQPHGLSRAADRIRGVTSNTPIMDEVQDLPQGLMPPPRELAPRSFREDHDQVVGRAPDREPPGRMGFMSQETMGGVVGHVSGLARMDFS